MEDPMQFEDSLHKFELESNTVNAQKEERGLNPMDTCSMYPTVYWIPHIQGCVESYDVWKYDLNDMECISE